MFRASSCLRVYKISVHAIAHRPQSSSFLGLPYRILHMNPKKAPLWGLWVILFSHFFQGYGLRLVLLGLDLGFGVWGLWLRGVWFVVWGWD